MDPSPPEEKLAEVEPTSHESIASSIPLEALLSFPLFWPSATVFAFFLDAHNSVKDDDVKALKLGMDTDPQAKQAIRNDWVAALGTSHWEILKSGANNRFKVPESSGKSAAQLLRIIRNKAEHNNHLRDDQKKTLDWFTNGELDQHKFVVYWTATFPNFLTFTWSKFHQFKDEPVLKQYYLSQFPDLDSLILKLNLEPLVQELTNSLNAHKENGGLLKRYKRSGTSQLADLDTLEFRRLTSSLIPFMMPWDCTLRVQINETGLSSTWINHTSEDDSIGESTLNVNFNLKAGNIQTDKGFHSLTIFVGNNLYGNKIFSSCAPLPVNVIFLTSNVIKPYEIQEIVGIYDTNHSVKLSEWKYNFSELTSAKQIEILQRNVLFQNKEVQFGSLLPKSFDTSQLTWLDGETLQKLLIDSRPALFEDTVVPFSGFYIPRRIISRGRNLTSKVLRTKDVFVVTNINVEVLEQLVKRCIVACKVLLTALQPRRRIFWVENETDYQEVYNILKLLPEHDNQNIHLLKYNGNDTFQCLRSRGSMKLLQNQKCLDRADNSVFEDDLLCHLTQQTTRQLIIIADKPGMGKTWLLRSLAEKLAKIENHFVILIALSDYMKALGKSKSKTKVNIIDTLSKLVSKTTVEQRLIKLWSETEASDMKVKCEIMIDGIDEVTMRNAEAKKVLNVLSRECPSFRLWITVRDHMLEESEDSLGVLGFKIVQFEEIEQIRFLFNYWQKQLLFKEVNSDEYKKLRKFAEICTESLIQGSRNSNFTKEIAGIPLQCRMVAEVYQSNAKHFLSIGDNDSVKEVTGLRLYEKMVDKKLKEYLRKIIPNLDLSLGIMDHVRLNTKKFHWYHAIRLLFLDSWADAFSILLTNGMENRTINAILEVGLIERLEPLTFIHRTIAEYFVALFVFEVFSGTIKLELSLQEVWASFVATNVLDVLSEQFDDPVTSSTILVATFRFPVMGYFLNAMLETSPDLTVESKIIMLVRGACHDFQNDFPFEWKKSVLVAAVRNNFFYTFKLLFLSLDINERDQFFSKIKDKHDFLLHVCLTNSSFDFFKYICTLQEDWYERIESLKYKISSQILCKAIRKGRYEIVKFLVLEKGFGPETWADLQNRNKHKFSLLHYCLYGSRKDKMSLLDEKKRIIDFLIRLDNSILEFREAKGRTPLLMLINPTSMVLKTWLVNQGADVNAVGSLYGNTGLHWCNFDNFRAAVPPFVYHDMLELFTSKNNFKINTVSRGHTPLHCAIKTYYDQLGHDSLDLFHKHGADFNILDEDGKSVLHLAIEMNCELEFIKKLIALGSNPKTKNTKGQDALDLAISYENTELKNLLESKNY